MLVNGVTYTLTHMQKVETTISNYVKKFTKTK